MMGFTEAYTLLAALSGVVGLWILLLWSYRRIPKHPPPDSIAGLRGDFMALADQFQEFVESHERAMGRNYAQVGHLRRKLSKLQEEEGLVDEDLEEADYHAPQTAAPVANFPTRDEQKRAVRAALKQRSAG